MKTMLFLSFTLFLVPATAQVAVNSDGSAPHASAMLEVTSNNSGVLIPRLTVAQRDAIPTPATGLMVYVTDDNLFHFYNGTAWVAIAPSAGNPTDELQTLSRTGTDVTLSDGGGTVSIADNDNDSSNELQTLSKTGTNVTLSNGGGTVSVADNDNDSSNELQTLSKSGNNLTLSNGGGTFSVADNDNDSTNELDSKWTVANGAIHHNSGEVGIGTNNPDALLHLSSATQSDATGLKITQESANSLIYHSDGDLILRKQSETNQLVLDTGGNVGIGTNTPASKLEVNGTLRTQGLVVEGGNPTANRVLRATGSSGTVEWGNPVDYAHDDNTSVFSILSGSGWGTFGAVTNISDVSNGDYLLVICSFRMKLEGGSGTDEANFRFGAKLGGESNYSSETGVVTDLRRNDWQYYSFHKVIQVLKGAGTYEVSLQVNRDLFDDTLRIDESSLTVINLR